MQYLAHHVSRWSDVTGQAVELVHGRRLVEIIGGLVHLFELHWASLQQAHGAYVAGKVAEGQAGQGEPRGEAGLRQRQSFRLQYILLVVVGQLGV